MTGDSSSGAGTPDEVAQAYGAFVGYLHPFGESPDGFTDWIRNLHDVYLNVEVAWLASLLVPPSDIEQELEEIGASRRQRLARFLARDMWVLWEAWDRRPQYHDAFGERAPSTLVRLRELEATGRSQGWFKRLRATRDYMNHRDKRDYLDTGRDELSEDAIVWMQALREAFATLLLSAMGVPLLPLPLKSNEQPRPSNSTTREIATQAVDDLLIGSASALQLGAGDNLELIGTVTGHLGRAFTAVACGSPQIWSESLTALIRRSVVAWSWLSEAPELRDLARELDLDSGSRSFMVAVTTEGVEDDGAAALATRSRLAVHRVTAWFNGHGDMTATLGAAVSVAGVLVSCATSLAGDEADVQTLVLSLGIEADGLLVEGDEP